MSKELPQPPQSEEVDLGQLFKLIGNMFDKLFKFIGSIFKKIFLAFVWLWFFIKNHFIKLFIAGVLGIGLGFLLQKTSDPIYMSYITVKQNYNTGENLYNMISYYNDLVKNEEYGVLKDVLELEENVASSVLAFEIKSILSENERIKEYDRYLKTLDTTVAKTVTYEMFLKNDKDYKHEFQEIKIQSKTRKNFGVVFGNIVKNINSNPYFQREQIKDLNELDEREKSLKEALIKSDSLQSTYKRVLEKALKAKNGSEIGITFEGSNDTDKTKEFDLYQSDIVLRAELVEINRKKADKEHIIEILSSKQDSGSIDNKKKFLGFKIGQKLFYGLLLGLLTFIVLLGLELIKYLEKFKDKI